MKFLSTLSVLAFVVMLTTIQFGASSCEKEVIIRDTIIVKDTINADTPITTQILASTVWKTQESRWLRVDGLPSYYLRGGLQNTESLANQTITFNTNGTGVLFDAGGYTAPFTWEWKNANSLKYTMIYPAPIGVYTVQWDHIIYKKGAIMFSDYVLGAGGNSMAGYSIWIPVSFTQNADVRLSK